MSTMFTEEEVKRLGSLARIDLRDDEVTRLAKDLNVINDSIAKVQEVATSDVEATSHPLPIFNVFREDIPATPFKPASDTEPRSLQNENPFTGDLLTVNEAIEGAPETEAGQFVAPQILGED